MLEQMVEVVERDYRRFAIRQSVLKGGDVLHAVNLHVLLSVYCKHRTCYVAQYGANINRQYVAHEWRVGLFHCFLEIGS